MLAPMPWDETFESYPRQALASGLGNAVTGKFTISEIATDKKYS